MKTEIACAISLLISINYVVNSKKAKLFRLKPYSLGHDSQNQINFAFNVNFTRSSPRFLTNDQNDELSLRLT